MLTWASSLIGTSSSAGKMQLTRKLTRMVRRATSEWFSNSAAISLAIWMQVKECSLCLGKWRKSGSILVSGCVVLVEKNFPILGYKSNTKGAAENFLGFISSWPQDNSNSGKLGHGWMSIW